MRIEVRLVIALAVGLLVFWFASLVIGWKEAAEANSAVATEAINTTRTASGIATANATAQDHTQRVEIQVTEGQQAYARNLEEAVRSDPSLADWRSAPIPERMRELARQREADRRRPPAGGDGRARDGEAEAGGR